MVGSGGENERREKKEMREERGERNRTFSWMHLRRAESGQSPARIRCIWLRWIVY